MTKPRTNPEKILLGLIGSASDSSEQKRYWNTRLQEEGIDGFFDHYPATADTLPEALSQMFHFDRRGYIVGKALIKAIIPLLDHVHLAESSGVEEGSGVNTVVNIGGVLHGYFLQDRDAIWQLWMNEQW